MKDTQDKAINRLSEQYMDNVKKVYENAYSASNLALMLNLLKEYNYLDFNLLYKAIIKENDADMAIEFFNIFVHKLTAKQIAALLTVIENNYKKGMFYKINRTFYRNNLDDNNQLSYLMERLALIEKNLKPTLQPEV